MTRRHWTSRLALAGVVVALVLVGVAGMVVAADPLYELGALDIFLLALAAALGDRLLLPRPHGRAVSVAVAVITAVALLSVDPALTTALAVAAWVARGVRLVRTGRPLRLESLALEAATAWAFGGAVALATAAAQVAEPAALSIGTSDLRLLPVVAAWVGLLVVLPALEVVRAGSGRDRRRLRYRDLIAGGFQPNVVLAATATLGALAYPALGGFTVLLMSLPLLAAKLGFDRNTETRTTYDQTLRAMSRLPEQLGAVDPGHGVRAGEVAALAAVELGFGADVVTDVERAAQLHELGRIRTEHGLDLAPDEVAQAGASIVREAGELDRVARLIAAHRGPVPVGDDVAWVGGAIVRLACDLDLRLVGRSTTPTVTDLDESWVRGQGVQPRIAEAVLHAARLAYAARLTS